MPRTTSRDARKSRKVLVYLFGSLGDSIVAIPALRAVRRHFADAEIVMLQNREDAGIVSASQVMPDGLVDRYLDYDSKRGRFEKVLGFGGLWNKLRRENFDAAVYLVMSERPARAVARDRAFFRSAGIKRLLGFHPISLKELYPSDGQGRPLPSAHEAEFKMNRLTRDGIGSESKDFETPLLTFAAAEIKEVESWLDHRRTRRDAPLITIGPGCKQQVNEWPVENFIELGRRLFAENPCELIIVGGPAEFETGEKMLDAWGMGINAAGAFPVRQSAALLSKSILHIGLDTGTTHLAAAAGTRCFAIFGGRNNPGLWYPLGPGHTVVQHPVPCSPCRVSECPVAGHPCMNEVSVDAVWYNLERFMNTDAATTGVDSVYV